jgi:hypothetical protein
VPRREGRERGGEGERREQRRHERRREPGPSTVASAVSSTASAAIPARLGAQARRQPDDRHRQHRQGGEAERIVGAVGEACRRPAPVRPEGEGEGAEAEQRPSARPHALGVGREPCAAGKASGLRRGGGAPMPVRTEARPIRAKREFIAIALQQPRRRTAAIATARIAR